MPHLQVSDISAFLTSLLPRLQHPSAESPALFAQIELLIHSVFRHLADLFFAAFLTSFLAHSDFEAKVVSHKLASHKQLRNKGKREKSLHTHFERLGAHALKARHHWLSHAQSAPKSAQGRRVVLQCDGGRLRQGSPGEDEERTTDTETSTPHGWNLASW